MRRKEREVKETETIQQMLGEFKGMRERSMSCR